ncbi:MULTISPECIES: hypothetical protein [Corynebacterium]|uniref:Uncharacterized protein n=1 Tax=Corynebacterium coyleae TaxID=53374 RepID=A0AAP6XNK0_9CORY|nr:MULTISPECIES: hypothetical protein [Corynebacterium]NJJ04378.1 hypothetical protein [Corynebacterium coyleae]OFU57821.1 hypothetical protein HMPREF3120_01720 [Corynebacterium sp. HMSC11D10]PLA27507.1 hypothetical protein CYJ45_08625 [Corynebacterium coyleae]PLA37919.1 hypothetical protein CYJ46_05150 [Corynebacterium coyleae]
MSNQRPLPPEIYMRRRVAALVILLVVVALLVWALSAMARSGGSGSDGATETSTEQTVNPTVATEPTVAAPEESASESASPSEEPSSSVEAAPARTGACELKDLRIKALPNQPSYAAGTEPVFYMEVENPTDTDCVIDLDENILRFEVYDMRTNERMWADTDCYQPVVSGTQTYKAGEKQGYQARWSGTVSQPGKCDDRPAIEPGSYFLHTVIGDNASEAAPFNIT